MSSHYFRLYIGQTDVAQDILRRRERVMYNCMHSCNAVGRLCTSCH